MQATTELKRHESPYDYASDRDKLKRFMLFFRKNGEYTYLSQIRSLEDRLNVDLDDVRMYDQTGLAFRMAENAWSYTHQLVKVVDELLYSEDMADVPVDILYSQRIARFKEKYPEKSILEYFPSAILRNYLVCIRPGTQSVRRDLLAIRDVGADDIGRLISVRGVVTKVSVVKPAARVATYICESCGCETYQQVNNDAFDMLEECGSEKCRTRNIRGTLTLLTRGSRFIRRQTVVLQELTSDVPHGSIPRLMKVEMNGPLTGQVNPGEVAVISGVFLPRPYHGLRKLKAGLLNDTYLQCTAVNMNRGDVIEETTERGEVQNGTEVNNDGITFANNNFVFNNVVIPSDGIMNVLVDSFAPEIYGMRDVKKILLLMLAGAPTLERPDGMRIRGDINCLLLGDPGIAKSQLLKTVVRISKRGVYTTGQGSSGVGLTAAVTKDSVTGEVVLEGGALVLSDRGICCIDELDKMNEIDRVSIHEVMEQQRVSIAKAGINCTLNARCGILAAANPVGGRYNPKRSVEHNVGLPCSLLSRFDVLCVLKDDAKADEDAGVAEHITSMHLRESAVAGEDCSENRSNRSKPLGLEPSNNSQLLDYHQITDYIEYIKNINPVLPTGNASLFIEGYLKARKENPSTTPRMLLAMIRLALAHARLHGRKEVSGVDVDEARELLEAMRIPMERPMAKPALVEKQIYDAIRKLAGERKAVALNDIYEKLEEYSKESIGKAIKAFVDCAVWVVEENILKVLN